MGCLDGFIGIRTPCLPNAADPVSGYYINDLTGISLERASAVNSAEQVSGYKLLEDRIAFAMKSMEEELSAELQQYIKFLPIADMDVVGNWDETPVYLATENEAKGVNICRNNSTLGVIRLHRIRAYTNTTGSRTITIGGANEVTTHTIVLVAGQVIEIDIDTTYLNRQVWVRWNTNDIAVNDSGIKMKDCRGCNSVSRNELRLPYATIFGKTDSKARTTSSYGLSVEFSVECSADQALCLMKNRLKQIALYRSGMAFLKEVVHSDRLNAITALRRDDAEELLEDYQEEYKRLFDQFASNISPVLSRMDKVCTDCKKVITASARL